MQQSVKVNYEPLLAAVEAELGALEALCGRMEAAMMRRRWADLDAAIVDSRRLTHALGNAMDEARGVRDEGFDRAVFQRIRYIHAIRQNQMVRLQQFNETVAERLRLMSRWKIALRTMSNPEQRRSRLASLNQYQ